MILDAWLELGMLNASSDHGSKGARRHDEEIAGMGIAVEEAHGEELQDVGVEKVALPIARMSRRVYHTVAA